MSKGDNFKELFKRLAAVGAGRPVDKDGFPPGPWTPDLLAEAITQIDANTSGIDLRTVQLWFQDNDKGISIDNIRWLARIFGCDDPEATSEWQAELSAAQSLLASKRRRRRILKKRLSTQHSDEMPAQAFETDQALLEAESANAKLTMTHIGLANGSEALFHGSGSLSLPIAIWAFGGLLWLLVYIAGVHSITYGLEEGLYKQVGFLWAPSWTVDRMVFIPLFVIAVTELLKFWKKVRRSLQGVSEDECWATKVESFSSSFWAILVVCLVIVFLVQWSGVYLRPLMQGVVGTSMVDWILVAIVRNDVVSITEAIALSGLANLYSAFAYWCYFCGLLLIYAVVHDFQEICVEPSYRLSGSGRYKAIEIGEKIVRGVFRCTVFGMLSATCIKLNAVYLISDAENILSWLVNDALAAMGQSSQEWGWITQSPSAYMTSFFVLLLTCFIFFICLAKTNRVFDRFSMPIGASTSEEDQRLSKLLSQAKIPWMKMIGIMVLLVANFFLIGQITGFSILLFGSVVVAIVSVTRRGGDAF